MLITKDLPVAPELLQSPGEEVSLYYQKTLRQGIECTGIGLHSGRKVTLRLLPALPDTGIVFRRLDKDGFEVPIGSSGVQRLDFATTIGVGDVEIKTVEHLLGAFYGMGVDNAIVELDASEVPIMDGSAAPFVYLIREAGLINQNRSRRYLRVVRPLEVQERDKWIKVLPSDDLRVTYTIAFDHPLIHQQTLTLPITEATFEDQIAPARTFGFMRDVEALRVRGLALGGSVDNAVVLGESKALNNDLRFVNEFVRHKILDVLGDLSLSGYFIKGHVIVHKGGHRLHAEMAKLLKTSLAVNEIESSEEGWSRTPELANPFA
jgi:UDP-3-O-[3-hydroxymyristoyl] N-acetylglucosamine deacetylase